MAKKSIAIKFTNATIEKDGDKYTIIETTKDETFEYDFTQILDELVNINGIKITISTDDDLETINT